MYIRKRIKKRRSLLKKHRILPLFLVCAGVCLLAFVYTNGTRNTARVTPPADPVQKFAPAPVEDPPPAGEVRAVYPYSIIPGGVQSAEELIAHVATDKVVADHYSDFKVSRTRIVNAEETRMMHVSYRMNDKVYWTKKKVKIPEGELLVADGDCEARARCGNRVSAAPQEPVSEEEPMMETFDFPQLARLIPPTIGPLPMVAFQWDPVPPVVPAIPRPELLPKFYRPIFPMKSSDTVVPEPGTLILLMTGLAALFTFRFFRKK
jgi:hypothetical protein